MEPSDEAPGACVVYVPVAESRMYRSIDEFCRVFSIERAVVDHLIKMASFNGSPLVMVDGLTYDADEGTATGLLRLQPDGGVELLAGMIDEADFDSKQVRARVSQRNKAGGFSGKPFTVGKLVRPALASLQ